MIVKSQPIRIELVTGPGPLQSVDSGCPISPSSSHRSLSIHSNSTSGQSCSGSKYEHPPINQSSSSRDQDYYMTSGHKSAADNGVTTHQQLNESSKKGHNEDYPYSHQRHNHDNHVGDQDNITATNETDQITPDPPQPLLQAWSLTQFYYVHFLKTV